MEESYRGLLEFLSLSPSRVFTATMHIVRGFDDVRCGAQILTKASFFTFFNALIYALNGDERYVECARALGEEELGRALYGAALSAIEIGPREPEIDLRRASANFSKPQFSAGALMASRYICYMCTASFMSVYRAKSPRFYVNIWRVADNGVEELWSGSVSGYRVTFGDAEPAGFLLKLSDMLGMASRYVWAARTASNMAKLVKSPRG